MPETIMTGKYEYIHDSLRFEISLSIEPFPFLQEAAGRLRPVRQKDR
jgi:hypothetical protein